MSSIDIPGAGFVLVTEAPIDGTKYARVDANWDTINVSDITNDSAVAGATAADAFDFLHDRIGSNHKHVMTLVSDVDVQAPSNTDELIVVNLNPVDVVANDGWYDSSTNRIYLNKGKYFINIRVSYGRQGGAGESELFWAGRATAADGSEYYAGTSLYAKLDDDKIGIPSSVTNIITIAEDGGYIEYLFWRDSEGHNSGGLYKKTPVMSGMPPSPSASATIVKLS